MFKYLKLFMAFVLVSSICACQKQTSEDPSPKQEELVFSPLSREDIKNSPLPEDVKKKLLETKQDKTYSEAVPGYSFLNSTGNGTRYFNAGTYAVRIKTSWYDYTTRSVVGTFRAFYPAQGSVYAYKVGTSVSSMLYNGAITDYTNIPTSIYGSEYAVYIMTVSQAGDFQANVR